MVDKAVTTQGVHSDTVTFVLDSTVLCTDITATNTCIQ